jgi:hypothetical protein
VAAIICFTTSTTASAARDPETRAAKKAAQKESQQERKKTRGKDTPTEPENSPPDISGVPSESVAQGEQYSFSPTANDPDNDILTFMISGQPAWTQFDSVTGELFGRPADDTTVGTSDPIVISVSDGSMFSSLSPFAITVTPRAVVTPTISGVPKTSVQQDTMYYFIPDATANNGAPLTFDIANQPGWTDFSINSGELTGIPTGDDAGIYKDIVISTDNGEANANIPAFSIEVIGDVYSGTVQLTWSPPTQNTDGTQLTDLQGYRVMYGIESGTYEYADRLNNPGITSHQIDGLTAGLWFFTVTAINEKGMESSNADEVSKMLGGTN